MPPLDLTLAVPATLERLGSADRPATVGEVLRSLGVGQAPLLGPTSASTGDDPVSLGRFQLLGELGRGGMGRVLEAHDPTLRRSVAVKLLIDPRRTTAEQLTRFVVEAQITSQLEHPNIVPVYDMGVTADGQVYFVMKKVQGRSFKDVLDGLREGDEQTVRVWTRTRLLHAFIQICNALAYAHDRGVLHRDVKPSNIMLGRFGEVLLMDWGVAWPMGSDGERGGADRVDAAATGDETLVGSPGYMAPEQALDTPLDLDARADVWSLGAVLYELLTLRRAYRARTTLALLHLASSQPPVDPREAAPELHVPDEIAEVCLQALALDRDERYAGASALAGALEGFLEGTRRREAAERHLAAAGLAWRQYGRLTEERARLHRRTDELEATLEPWSPLDQKAELLDVRARLRELDLEQAGRFEGVLFSCEQALSQDPESDATRAFLAAVHYARFEEAEAAADTPQQEHHRRRVLHYDEGRFAPLLRGIGSLTLRTEPAGAEVLCQRYERRGLIWTLGAPRCLGKTPLEDRSMEPGSYLLTIRRDGLRDTRYPVWLRRGGRWRSGDEPVPLFTEWEIGDGFVYVPAGPFVAGGDPAAQDCLPAGEPWVGGFFIAVLPLCVADYLPFINHLAAIDAEQAWRRVPRQASGLTEVGGQYWDRAPEGAPYVIPEVDRDGDRWDPRWPAFGMSYDDAVAFAAWWSDRAGGGFRLPLDLEWEKAARGADGRIFPWGDDLDPTLCKIRNSRPGTPHPEVVGAFATDVSPYGVRDVSGGVREWCGDESYLGDPDRRPIRGGSWITGDRFARLADRYGDRPFMVSADMGFRLARDLPGAGRGARWI